MAADPVSLPELAGAGALAYIMLKEVLTFVKSMNGKDKPVNGKAVAIGKLETSLDSVDKSLTALTEDIKAERERRSREREKDQGERSAELHRAVTDLKQHVDSVIREIRRHNEEQDGRIAQINERCAAQCARIESLLAS